MTPSFLAPTRFFTSVAVALIGLIALPQLAEAKGPKHFKHGKNKEKHDSRDNDHDNRDGHDDHDREVYTSRPRSSFVLSPGNGYAGRGYYYGPPNSPYYYERSDVRYFATREAAPREYYGNDGSNRNSTDASVQRALSQRGYYNGSIDGAIGPESRRSIARYQRDNGLRSSGNIDSNLLQSLGLQ